MATLAPGVHYVAWRLTHVADARLTATMDGYLVDLHRRMVAFLDAAFVAHSMSLTFDMRLIARSAHGESGCARLTAALLTRLESASVEAAGVVAVQISGLLTALFEEYEVVPVAAAEIPRLLEPFPIRDLRSIRRRAILERLDSATPARRQGAPGFVATNGATPVHAPATDAVFHVAPFLASEATLDGVLNLLVAQSTPIAISVRFAPVVLSDGEVAFIREQVTRCERYGQVGIASAIDPARLQPTLREHARLLQEYQDRSLFSLASRAAVVCLDVASAAPLTESFIASIAAVMFEPAGGSRAGVERTAGRCLAGGAEVVTPAPHTLPSAIEAFRTLTFHLPPHPSAPPDAGRLVHLFDPTEAASLLPFPRPALYGYEGLEVRSWRSQRSPSRLPNEGSLVGMTAGTAPCREVRIAPDDRRRSVYLLGATGTGKTTALRSMIVEDMRAGRGLCVIDPHGDLYEDLLGSIPSRRVSDVVLLDPTDGDYPAGLNMLEHETDAQRHFIIQEVVSIITRLMVDEYGPTALGQMAGPVFFQHMRMNLLLATSNPEDPGTLLDVYAACQDNHYWKRWLPLRRSDPLLDRWLAEVLPKIDYTRQGSDGPSMGSYVGSKFEGFVFDPMLRHVFAQPRSTIDLRAVMDESKILLVNLAKGQLTAASSRFLGMVLLGKLMAVAMRRAAVPERERRDFSLYVDEFQSVATRSFVTLLSEARKFGVSLVLANQSLGQIDEPALVQAVLNVGSLVCFRVRGTDAEVLERHLGPAVTRQDLANLPNWHAYMTSLVDGCPTSPFSIQTIGDKLPTDVARASRVRAVSRRRYARPRLAVEAEIARRFERQGTG